MRIDLSPFQSPCEPMTSNVFPDTILEKKHERFGWVFMKLHTHTLSTLCTLNIVLKTVLKSSTEMALR